ncbi:alpha/beta family hydrolase [Marinimicrobium sp. ABcell2]|uniref:alpha/beta family hydrolase n=1 Tax=Marinimicrobium sp. ABcell2 TaxID=3069751 RepID=UPI0027B15D6E|nr:alpha/beta family hydrolase [Marinimicrobium sp. ABcell2]MDQ2075238.1 dienelactone hydrolase family protein [Marinimicrobium sp. ABcell2]
MKHFLCNTPVAPRARLLLAHGAGAAMDTPFMNRMAEGLCEAGIEVWRFEFPYMASRRTGGSKRPPDRQPVLLAAWHDRIQEARANWNGPLFIGGKSMGGRMASLVADDENVDGLVCLGYPFHPPKKPEKLRTDHLHSLRTPCLIVQGSRDPLGNREEVAHYELAPTIQLHWLEDGDHDFKPRVKSGYTHEQHLSAANLAVSEFINNTASVL